MRARRPVRDGYAERDRIIIKRPGGAEAGQRELLEWIGQWISR
jgi:hypothetical protein